MQTHKTLFALNVNLNTFPKPPSVLPELTTPFSNVFLTNSVQMNAVSAILAMSCLTITQSVLAKSLIVSPTTKNKTTTSVWSALLGLSTTCLKSLPLSV